MNDDGVDNTSWDRAVYHEYKSLQAANQSVFVSIKIVVTQTIIDPI